MIIIITAQDALRISEETVQASKVKIDKLLEDVESKEVEIKSFKEMKTSLLTEVANAWQYSIIGMHYTIYSKISKHMHYMTFMCTD